MSQEENRIVRDAVTRQLPTPPKSPNPYQPDKRSTEQDWRGGKR